MEFTWHASIGGVKYSQEHLRRDVIHRHHISTFIPSCYILPLYQWRFLCRPSSQWSLSVLPVPGGGCLPSQVLIIMDITVASISSQRSFGHNLELTLHGSWMSHVATIEVCWPILPTHNTQHYQSVSRLLAKGSTTSQLESGDIVHTFAFQVLPSILLFDRQHSISSLPGWI